MLETIAKIQPIITMVFVIFSFIGTVIAVYKFSSDPDKKAHEEIGLIKQKCAILHGGIDKAIQIIKDDVKLIKVNHLSHIEKDVKKLNENQVKIFTILDERLPKKN